MTIQNKQQPKQYTSRIIIKSLEGGGKHIFVRCKVGGTKSLMLIDTGCSNTVFDSGSEVFAGIRMHEVKGTNKNFSLNAAIDDVKIGKIKDFAIGRFTTDINRGVFISLEHINSLYESMIGERIIGILGSDFMRKYKAIIDFGKGSMSVEN